MTFLHISCAILLIVMRTNQTFNCNKYSQNKLNEISTTSAFKLISFMPRKAQKSCAFAVNITEANKQINAEGTDKGYLNR